MDPDVTLAQMRRWAAYRADYLTDPIEQSAADRIARQIADSFAELDAWLSAGGFLPAGWAIRNLTDLSQPKSD